MLETTKNYPHRGEAEPRATCDTNMNDYENQTKNSKKKLFLSIKIATAHGLALIQVAVIPMPVRKESVNAIIHTEAKLSRQLEQKLEKSQ